MLTFRFAKAPTHRTACVALISFDTSKLMSAQIRTFFTCDAGLAEAVTFQVQNVIVKWKSVGQAAKFQNAWLTANAASWQLAACGRLCHRFRPWGDTQERSRLRRDPGAGKQSFRQRWFVGYIIIAIFGITNAVVGLTNAVG
jgi:hypothetical protein